MTTYIAHDDTHIHGLGSTPAEAEADALSCCRDLTGLKTALCTAALFAQVQTEGGAITWEEIDGTACTACTQAEYDLDLAAHYMDDDIREDIHSHYDAASDASKFLAEYERRHEAKYNETFSL